MTRKLHGGDGAEGKVHLTDADLRHVRPSRHNTLLPPPELEHLDQQVEQLVIRRQLYSHGTCIPATPRSVAASPLSCCQSCTENAQAQRAGEQKRLRGAAARRRGEMRQNHGDVVVVDGE